MGWFSKKKEVNAQEEFSAPEVPTLPELPKIEEEVVTQPKKRPPEIPKQKLESQQIPSLPKSPGPTSLPELPKLESEKRSLELPTLPKGMKESKFAPLPTTNKTERLEIPPISRTPTLPERKIKEKPIYIRLDKFEHTEESFNEIRNKIIEIESLLSKIRETKTEEERNLEDWEREIQVIKARIESIDKNIFNKF